MREAVLAVVLLNYISLGACSLSEQCQIYPNTISCVLWEYYHLPTGGAGTLVLGKLKECSDIPK